jgi:hypothetical protein
MRRGADLDVAAAVRFLKIRRIAGFERRAVGFPGFPGREAGFRGPGKTG